MGNCELSTVTVVLLRSIYKSLHSVSVSLSRVDCETTHQLMSIPTSCSSVLEYKDTKQMDAQPLVPRYLTREAQVTGVATMSLCLTWISVLLRFYVRIRLLKFVGSEDWLTFATMVGLNCVRKSNKNSC